MNNWDSWLALFSFAVAIYATVHARKANEFAAEANKKADRANELADMQSKISVRPLLSIATHRTPANVQEFEKYDLQVVLENCGNGPAIIDAVRLYKNEHEVGGFDHRENYLAAITSLFTNIEPQDYYYLAPRKKYPHGYSVLAPHKSVELLKIRFHLVNALPITTALDAARIEIEYSSIAGEPMPTLVASTKPTGKK